MTSDAHETIDELETTAPERLDLTNTDQLARAQEGADRLLSHCNDLEPLSKLEEELARSDKSPSLLVHLALKLARSKAVVRALPDTVLLSVEFAMYRESARIQRRSEHPHGEDFLRRKIAQPDWLTDDASRRSPGRRSRSTTAVPKAPARAAFLSSRFSFEAPTPPSALVASAVRQ